MLTENPQQHGLAKKEQVKELPVRKSLIFSVEMNFHLILSMEMLKTQLDVNPGQPALLDPAWVISRGPFQPQLSDIWLKY